jgi:hypothetical protein
MSLKDDCLKAARADAIPQADAGLWYVRKIVYKKNTLARRDKKLVEVPAGSYTYLMHLNEEKMHIEPPGEVVMTDTPDELKTHLEFMLRAFGEVLVTGLGLGCVVRGLLQNPAVGKITVVERSFEVLKLVGQYMPKDPRILIVLADALKWVPLAVDHGHKWDCAWHDLWTDNERGEPHLQIWHAKLIAELYHATKFQGAWAFPREQKRAWQRIANLI